MFNILHFEKSLFNISYVWANKSGKKHATDWKEMLNVLYFYKRSLLVFANKKWKYK